MQLTLVSALAFAASVSAIMITAPASNATVDLSTPLKITWTSVDTDPSTINIELVNENVNPSLSQTIATGVQTSSGSYTLNSDAVPVGDNYQINLVSDSSLNTGILAQSGRFTVSKAVVSSSSMTSTSTSTSTTSTSSSSSSSSSGTTTTTGSTTSTETSSTKTTTASSTSGSSTTASSTSGSSSSHAASSASATAAHTGAASALTISSGSLVAAILALVM